MADLLERLSSSCLSATVDFSSRSHNRTLMRWEFLMIIGTSSNICSKPMLAFFKLEDDKQDKGKKKGYVKNVFAMMFDRRVIEEYNDCAISHKTFHHYLFTFNAFSNLSTQLSSPE